MESTLPEITDETIVCFQHIKVEMLVGKKPEFEMPPKDFFFFHSSSFLFLQHTSKSRGERALISQAKTKRRSPLFCLCLLFIHQEITLFFSSSSSFQRNTLSAK